MLHFRAGRAGIPEDVYPDMEEFYADVAAAYRAEVADLADAGCRYLQFDDTNLAYLCDTCTARTRQARGMDPDAITHDYAKLINASFASAPGRHGQGASTCAAATSVPAGRPKAATIRSPR